MNKFEKRLLYKLANGKFNGQVGTEIVLHKKIRYGTRIENGEPVLYQSAESMICLNDIAVKHSCCTERELTFDSDEDKLRFLQRYGWLIQDDDAKAYSKFDSLPPKV